MNIKDSFKRIYQATLYLITILDKIIRWSVENKIIVFLLVFGVVGFGSYSLTKIPIDAVPDVTNNQLQVITACRNLSTEEVEKYLAYPIELEMVNLPGVKEIRSVSKFGYGRGRRFDFRDLAYHDCPSCF